MLPVILIAIQALVATASLHSLSILGVYIEAGSDWSRTQQTATNFLIQYLDRGDEHDYEKFLVAVAKDIDSNAARRALEKPEPDIPAATASFLRFGIYPYDIPGAIFMYVHLRQYSYFRQPIAIWQDTDAALVELEALGETIHAQVAQSGPPRGDAALKTRLRELDERLSTMCDAFSKALGAEVRAVTTLVTFANLALAIGLMMLVVWRMGALFRRSQRFESALSSEKQRAQVTLESIGDAVIRINAAGRVEYANPSAERLIGMGQAEAQGRELASLIAIVDEASGRAYKHHIEALLKGEELQSSASSELTLVTAARSTPVSVQGRPSKSTVTRRARSSSCAT